MYASINPLMSNKKAFSITQTVHQFGAKLMGFISSKVGSKEDAEDILQDVWFQFSRLTNIEDIKNISGWLYRVAKNKVTDNQRKHTTDSLEEYSSTDGERNLKDILLLDPSGNPELALFKEVFWNTVLVAVLHVSIITYWQALGIFILSKLLFGGNMMSGRHYKGGMNRQMRDKFMNMTQEEKEAFKQEWKEKFRM